MTQSMTIRLWNRDLIISAAQAERLTTWILDYLASRKSGEESISFLIGEIRCGTKMGFPTRLIDAETIFEALGFTLRREYKETRRGPHIVLRTYVTV